MAVIHYTDTPLLFVNSTDSVIPTGRNVRIKSRSQVAAASERRAHGGDFAVLDFRSKRHSPSPDDDGGRPAAKRARGRKNTVDGTDRSTSPSKAESSQRLSSSLVKQPQINPLAYHPFHPVVPSSLLLDPEIWTPIRNPSNVLVVAAFHIRRMTANALQGHPDRLTQVLRFRQWSCVPTALERFGTSACLDSALACLALKLDRMTGGSTAYRSLLVAHTWALHELQSALDRPQQHDLRDLFTATQLLAVFEMLDSLDNEVWLKHVAGAGSLLMARSVRSSGEHETASILVPMITDALLSDNPSAIRRYDWRSALHSLISTSPSAEAAMVNSSLINALQLILDVSNIQFQQLTSQQSFKLLDRAHLIKVELQTSVKSDACAYRDFGKVESFDKLGLCLAELLALDRLIASLRPREMAGSESEEARTSALCAQLLQLELRDADGNPALELLSAFQLSK